MGTNDSFLKYAEYTVIGEDFVPFLATAFLFAMVLGIVVMFFQKTSFAFD